MGVRIVSGLVAAAVLIAATWAGGWWFAALAIPALVITSLEMMAMAQPDDRPGQVLGAVLTVGVALGIMAGELHGELGLAAWAGTLVLLALWFLLRTGSMETVASRLGLTAAGVAWIGVLGGWTASLALLDDGFGWLIFAAALAFGSDVGGYFVGRALGRHRLYPKVSPNKTVEGSVGGIIVAIGIAYGFRQVIGPELHPGHFAVIAPAGALLGQLGDLAQSLLKRSVGVKDSGAIMPGHGGLFDRIDALLFVGPPLYLYARWVVGVEAHYLSF